MSLDLWSGDRILVRAERTPTEVGDDLGYVLEIPVCNAAGDRSALRIWTGWTTLTDLDAQMAALRARKVQQLLAHQREVVEAADIREATRVARAPGGPAGLPLLVALRRGLERLGNDA
ncbi:hypothetical protein ACFVGM_09020 [Kitasatospora purpeofusca]|uniref:hypothetical protein n=1 Tax=Kitasatospora purpeofusca TaxID=67352 RepID=UPI0036BB8EB8